MVGKKTGLHTGILGNDVADQNAGEVRYDMPVGKISASDDIRLIMSMLIK